MPVLCSGPYEKEAFQPASFPLAELRAACSSLSQARLLLTPGPSPEALLSSGGLSRLGSLGAGLQWPLVVLLGMLCLLGQKVNRAWGGVVAVRLRD